MIWMLARRTLGDRPRRTAMLMLGLGIAVGLMITLLSIGEAVLLQARDKDLVGGGDLVVLPAGIDVEVMKMGGATGMYLRLENARFLYRQVLCGPRFAPDLATVAPERPDSSVQVPDASAAQSAGADALPLVAASPAIVDRVIYVRRARSASAPVEAFAHGFIPSLDAAAGGPTASFASEGIRWHDHPRDRLWAAPPVDSLYNDMDRFHLPPADRSDRDTWAEWLYFNFTDTASGTFGYASLIVTGDIAAGKGRARPSLQIQRPGAPELRFQDDAPLSAADISLARVDLRLGGRTTAAFFDGAYHLHLEWDDRAGPVRCDLVVRPVPDLYNPPFLIHESERFLSGYAVPALRTLVSGRIRAPGVDLDLRQVPGYHDHNWGTWRNVHWEWGTTSSAEYALLYGRVEHPELDPGRSGAGVFLMLSQARRDGTRGGVLAMFRPERIDYTWNGGTPPHGPLPGDPAQLPATIRMSATSESALEAPDGAPPDRIEVQVDVEDVTATPPRPGEEPRVFLQLHGKYTVHAVVGGRDVRFTAPGFAEVFVTSRQN